MRPLTQSTGLTTDGDQKLCLTVTSPSTIRLLSKPEPRTFTYDHVADMDTSQVGSIQLLYYQHTELRPWIITQFVRLGWSLCGLLKLILHAVCRVFMGYGLEDVGTLLVCDFFVCHSSIGVCILQCGQEHCWVVHEWIQWYYICLVSGLYVVYKLYYIKNILWHNHSALCFMCNANSPNQIPLLLLQRTNRLRQNIHHAWWELNMLFTLCSTWSSNRIIVVTFF